MARKRYCSKSRRRTALNNGPKIPMRPTRGEKTRTRRIKVRLRIEIKDLMQCAYALYHGYKEPRMSQISNRFITYYHFPDTAEKRDFMLTYIGCGIWDHLDAAPIEDLRRAREWAQRCYDDMTVVYHKRRFWRNTRWIIGGWLLISAILIFSL